MHGSMIVWGLSLGLLTSCARCGARTERPSYTLAIQSGLVVTIDGKLDDVPWAQAPRTAAFVRPGTGRAARSLQAHARLLADKAGMYIAFEVADPDPSSRFSPSQRDPHIWESASGVEVMLQPGTPTSKRKANTHYYEIQVDVNGAVFDTRYDDYNRPVRKGATRTIYGHERWTSRARRAVRRSNEGYNVELFVPWKAIDNPRGPVPPDPGDTWRLNLYAFREGQSESVGWSALLKQGNFHRTTRFGRLVFSD